jgi:flavin-binding protein dodecin
MSVAKVVEICAGSKAGLQDAVEKGIERASKTLNQVQGAWVQDIKVDVDNGRVSEWRVNLKVTFVLE